ncbi:hypothetical protein D3C80_1793960 [compost metagenome]
MMNPESGQPNNEIKAVQDKITQYQAHYKQYNKHCLIGNDKFKNEKCQNQYRQNLSPYVVEDFSQDYREYVIEETDRPQ